MFSSISIPWGIEMDENISCKPHISYMYIDIEHGAFGSLGFINRMSKPFLIENTLKSYRLVMYS